MKTRYGTLNVVVIFVAVGVTACDDGDQGLQIEVHDEHHMANSLLHHGHHQELKEMASKMIEDQSEETKQLQD
jgi:hypothetical protein